MQVCNLCSPHSQEKGKCSRHRSCLGILTPKFYPQYWITWCATSQWLYIGETLVIYLRLVQAWMLCVSHKSSTTTGLSVPLFTLRNSDLVTPLCDGWLVFSVQLTKPQLTPLHCQGRVCTWAGSAGVIFSIIMNISKAEIHGPWVCC